jgi:hypothetical protein
LTDDASRLDASLQGIVKVNILLFSVAEPQFYDSQGFALEKGFLSTGLFFLSTMLAINLTLPYLVFTIAESCIKQSSIKPDSKIVSINCCVFGVFHSASVAAYMPSAACGGRRERPTTRT